MYRKFLLIVFICLIGNAFAGEFVHPGMLHKASDLQRMKEQVELEAEPWYSGWEVLVDNSLSSADYSMRGPVDTVYRGSDGVHSENYYLLYYDAHAAYQNALRWHIAGTEDNAVKAIEILNAWGKTLKYIGGDSNFALATGIYGYEIANAAELMRDYDGWSTADFETFKQMMLDVFYTGAKRFLDNHNGTCSSHYWANWDLCNMASVLSVGILCDSSEIYDEAVDYFKSGIGTGCYDAMVPYVYDGNLAQWQESGRDQGHTTLGVALAGAFCEMAWNQGDDLYGYDDNRLWKGFNYIAKYNLGNAVPFTTYTNCEDVEHRAVSPSSRNMLRAGWELIYNHYVNIKGLYSPYIDIMASQVRPEGGGGNYGSNSGGFDQMGFGTLTATLETPPKQSQTISFSSGYSICVGDSDLAPGAVSTSGLEVIYTSENPDIAEIVNNKIHAKLSGTATITAYQVGNDLYEAATSVSRTVTVSDSLTYVEGLNKIYVSANSYAVDVSGNSLANGGKIIQWSNGTGSNQNWTFDRIDGNYYSIISELSGKALDVVSNSDEAGTAIEQRTYTGEDYQLWNVTDNGDGTFSIKNKGNGLYLSVQGESSSSKGSVMEVNEYSGTDYQKFELLQLESDKKTQLISFASLDTTEMSNSEITLSATSSSGLSVYYSSTDTSVAKIVGNKIIVEGGGTAGIIASCDGNDEYDPALDVEQQLVVNRQSQTITADEFPTLTYQDDDYEIQASASSGLDLSYYSYNTSVVRMLSNKIRVMGGGDVTVLIYQVGNNQYDPVYLYKDITVLKLDQTISFPELPEMNIGDSDYSPRASASSYLKVSYTSSDTTVAKIVNYRIRPKAVGECVITATQDGDSKRYNAAPEVSQTLKVVDPSALDETTSEVVNVFVNRSEKLLVVDVPTTFVGDGSIQVYDIRGIKISNVAIQNSTTKISLNNDANSILFVKICNQEDCVVKKVLW